MTDLHAEHLRLRAFRVRMALGVLVFHDQHERSPPLLESTLTLVEFS